MRKDSKIEVAALGIIIIVLVVIAVLYVRSTFSGAGSATAQSSNQPISTVQYMCDAGNTITASYYAGSDASAASANSASGSATSSADQPPMPSGSVNLILSDGRIMTLPQAISADGARYANADGSFVFWSKGNSTMVLENGAQKTYTGCIAVAPAPADGSLPAAYANSADGFSIRLPSLATSTPSPNEAGSPTAYTADATYQYQELGPGDDINGVKFTIPGSVAAGTNLGADSYISVERIPLTVAQLSGSGCSASLFLEQGPMTSPLEPITDAGTTYSVASSTGAGAGNRYFETVYALAGTSPCVAVRYFIHYGVIDNYPPGTVKQFDQASLMAQFDAIRRTLLIAE